MPSVPYWIVDVFSTTAYKGNPLAVVDNTEANLSDAQMKLITRQFNLSETTFFLKPTAPGATYYLRSFLPDGKEVFGAGHNILGAWWFLAASGRLDLTTPQTVRDGLEEHVFFQQLGEQVTPVSILKKQKSESQQHMSSGGGAEISVSMRQAPPKAHAEHPDPASLAASVGLASDDVGFQHVKADGTGSVQLTPQVMSTSTTRHLLVPLASVEALDKVVVQKDKLLEQLAKVDKASYGLFLFTPVKGAQDAGRDSNATYRARFFSPGMSGEDPATGSAAGPLSAYLHLRDALRQSDGRAVIEVQQGHRVGRECVIRVELTQGNDGQVNVDLVGSGVEVGQGQMTIPASTTLF